MECEGQVWTGRARAEATAGRPQASGVQAAWLGTLTMEGMSCPVDTAACTTRSGRGAGRLLSPLLPPPVAALLPGGASSCASEGSVARAATMDPRCAEHAAISAAAELSQPPVRASVCWYRDCTEHRVCWYRDCAEHRASAQHGQNPRSSP
jgi:hypothetical protein